MNDTSAKHAAIVGAGPIGLETAIELKKAGLDYYHFDKGQIASTIGWFPEGMTFFSSADRIAIAGHPLQTTNQTKATKEQYLAYLRSMAIAWDLNVRTYEAVTAIDRDADGVFTLRTRDNAGEHTYRARNLILAVGDMHRPRMLGIPGEELPHVSHYFRDPHAYFNKRVLIIGGRNSAAEAALRCYHAGAKVAISYRRGEFGKKSVKYWIRPELVSRIAKGEIDGFYGTVPTRISPTHVTLADCDEHGEPLPAPRRNERDVPADFVLALVGYVAEPTLLEMAGVELTGPNGETPTYDERTMETNVPGVYVAGTAIAGSQTERYTVFIENCHIHARRIAAALTGAPPPEPAPSFEQPES